ncbi:MAG: pilus assembly protein [Acidobacteriota bacterium]|nr:pilus assembly protein [Acidobacteriota bacterium]
MMPAMDQPRTSEPSRGLTRPCVVSQAVQGLNYRCCRVLPQAGHSEDGSSLVEFAVVMPVLLLFLTGMMTFGIALNQYLQLTDSVRIGAEAAAIARGTTTDPCSTATTASDAALSSLTKTSITYSFTINGSTYTGTTCTSALSNMLQGKTFQMKATYPCSMVVYGVLGSVVNYDPSGCTLTAQTAEMIQ